MNLAILCFIESFFSRLAARVFCSCVLAGFCLWLFIFQFSLFLPPLLSCWCSRCVTVSFSFIFVSLLHLVLLPPFCFLQLVPVMFPGVYYRSNYLVCVFIAFVFPHFFCHHVCSNWSSLVCLYSAYWIFSCWNKGLFGLYKFCVWVLSYLYRKICKLLNRSNNEITLRQHIQKSTIYCVVKQNKIK